MPTLYHRWCIRPGGGETLPKKYSSGVRFLFVKRLITHHRPGGALGIAWLGLNAARRYPVYLRSVLRLLARRPNQRQQSSAFGP